jgi:hypothetical protein
MINIESNTFLQIKITGDRKADISVNASENLCSSIRRIIAVSYRGWIYSRYTSISSIGMRVDIEAFYVAKQRVKVNIEQETEYSYINNKRCCHGYYRVYLRGSD